jgi:hypothetical protein
MPSSHLKTSHSGSHFSPIIQRQGSQDAYPTTTIGQFSTSVPQRPTPSHSGHLLTPHTLIAHNSNELNSISETNPTTHNAQNLQLSASSSSNPPVVIGRFSVQTMPSSPTDSSQQQHQQPFINDQNSYINQSMLSLSQTFPYSDVNSILDSGFLVEDLFGDEDDVNLQYQLQVWDENTQQTDTNFPPLLHFTKLTHIKHEAFALTLPEQNNGPSQVDRYGRRRLAPDSNPLTLLQLNNNNNSDKDDEQPNNTNLPQINPLLLQGNNNRDRTSRYKTTNNEPIPLQAGMTAADISFSTSKSTNDELSMNQSPNQFAHLPQRTGSRRFSNAPQPSSVDSDSSDYGLFNPNKIDTGTNNNNTNKMVVVKQGLSDSEDDENLFTPTKKNKTVSNKSTLDNSKPKQSSPSVQTKNFKDTGKKTKSSSQQQQPKRNWFSRLFSCFSGDDIQILEEDFVHYELLGWFLKLNLVHWSCEQ